MATKTAYDIIREVSALPDVYVNFMTASPMLGPDFNEDEIELDMSEASPTSKDFVRELTGDFWEITKTDTGHWFLESNYYPDSTEDMLEIRDVE